MTKAFLVKLLFLNLAILLFFDFASAQKKKAQDDRVRTMTVPISIFTKEELKQKRISEFVEAGDLIVKEDGDQQIILSIRSVSEAPLEIAVLIQDNLSSSVNLELSRISEFIRRLPQGSKVMVAYLRGGTLQVRQKFTDDLNKAAESLRIVFSNSNTSSNPYDGVSEAVKRFDALPTGRRAILLVSDGLDISRGIETFNSLQSVELDQTILSAQRRGVAVYSFYTSSALTEGFNSRLSIIGQGMLNRLSDETGGRAFFQGTQSPVSFDPFFKDLNLTLTRQFALTYLSTHMKKGYHKVQITSTNPQIRIEHPEGYFYK